MELDEGEQVIFVAHPSWRSMPAFHLKGFLAAISAGVLAGLLSAAASGRTDVWWVVLGVVAVFAVVISGSAIRLRRTTYTITSRRLAIEIGLVARDVYETRLERIQNVRSTQTALERLLDVGTVAFDTAGGDAREFNFRGVAQPRRIARSVSRALHERAASGV